MSDFRPCPGWYEMEKQSGNNRSARSSPVVRNAQGSSDGAASQPPPYSSYSSDGFPETQPTAQDVIPGLPSLKFSAYRLPDSSISEDRSTITTWSAPLLSGLGSLLSFVNEQAALPPKPEVHIVGRHKGHHGIEEDFNIRLDLFPYLIPETKDFAPAHLNLPHGHSVPLKSPAAMERLRKDAGVFWNTSQRAKCLVINRRIKNWDTEYIEGRIRSLLSEIRYRGETTIAFPTPCSSIVVRPAKGIADIFSIFAQTLTVNIDIDWPFADVERGRTSSGVVRQCNVCDEPVWWNTWHATLRDAILSKQKGWVGKEAWLECAMGYRPVSKKPQPWGMDV